MTCRISFRRSFESAQALDRPLIVDGEVVAWKDNHVLTFAQLQKRFGRKQPSPALMQEIPVVMMIFDVLFTDGRTVIDQPLSARKEDPDQPGLAARIVARTVPSRSRTHPVGAVLRGSRGSTE